MEETSLQKSGDVWASGWRPFFGWTGGVGMLYTLLLQPLFTWYARIHGWPEPPTVNTEVLTIVTTGVLGIGGLRTYEKQKGVAK